MGYAITNREEYLHNDKITMFPQAYNSDTASTKNTEGKTRKHNIGNSTLMDCLHSEEEIKAVFDVFVEHIEEASTMSKKRISIRNLTMFICAINIGLRGGDFCRLKWNNIFDKNWNFLADPDFVPEKTSGRNKHVRLSWGMDFEIALTNWLNWLNKYDHKQQLDEYIFTGSKESHDNETGISIGNAIQVRSWWRIMENARKEAGIRQKIGTHGCRKTMVNRFIKLSDDKTEAIIQMQSYLNHSSPRITMGYACIERESIHKTMDKMSLLDKFTK